MTESNLVGNVREPKANYDLLTVVMLCIGEPEDDTGTEILDLLNVLLSSKAEPEQKCRVLENEFQIKMTQQLNQEVSLMCNLSKGVEDRGIAIGREKGRENEKKVTARRLQKMGMPIEVIAQSVDRNTETVKKWLFEAYGSN